jgi:hypothetical protein
VPKPFSGRVLNKSIAGVEICLPTDYLEFMAIYGAGSFCDNGFIFQVFDLCGTSDAQIVKTCLDDLCPDQPPPFPKIPGLLPWGEHADGLTFYWQLPSIDPSTWRVAVRDRLDVTNTGMTFVEFLVRFASNTYPSDDKYSDLFPDFHLKKYFPFSKREFYAFARQQRAK